MTAAVPPRGSELPKAGVPPEISIVLPVHNQAEHLGTVVSAYRSVLDSLRHSFELILVVNESTDGSLQVSRDLAGAFGDVRFTESDAPGWGRAVRVGLRAARGGTLSYANSARTSAPTLGLLTMLALANPDCVLKANRRLRAPLIRRLGSVLYNFECRMLFNLAVWDINGTPKAFSRAAAEKLDLRQDGDLIDLEFAVKCRRLGLQILEVPVVSSARFGGTSTTTFRSALQMYRGALRMWREERNRHAAAAPGRVA